MNKPLKILAAVCGGIIAVAVLIRMADGIRGMLSGGKGPPTKEEVQAYLQQISPIAAELAKTVEQTAPAYEFSTEPEKKEKALIRLLETKTKFEQLAEQARNIKVEGGLREPHQRFVKAMSGYMDAFDSTKEGWHNNDPQTIDQSAAQLIKAAEEFNKVSQEIVSIRARE